MQVRVSILCVLLLASGGCVRNLRAEQAYHDSLRADFEQHPFRVSLPEAKLRLRTLAQSSPERACAPCVFVDRCTGESCSFRVGTSSEDEACLTATEKPYGVLHFQVTCGDRWRVDDTVQLVWEDLEPDAYADAETRAQGALARVTLDEARSFTPRWGLTAGAFGALGSASLGYGARLGVRRWNDPNLIAGALVEYEYTWFDIPPAPVGSPKQAGHLVTGELRAEVAPWSAWTAKTSLPEFSLYMLGGGSVLLDDANPGFGGGFRFGFGGHAVHYTRTYSLPFFLEVHLSRLFFTAYEATSVRMTIGVGF